MDNWQAEAYQENAAFVANLGQPLLDILKPLAHEQILDLGCGHGTLTQQIVPLCQRVVGVDASENMIRHAKSIGIDARVVDGQSLNFDSDFDAIFSNAALHWMLQPEAVLNGCFRALKPGGRMVAEMGGCGNVEKIVTALNTQREQRGRAAVMPWFFPTPQEYMGLAQHSGFAVQSIQLFDRPTRLPTGIRQWLTTFAHHFISDLSPVQGAQLLDDACESLKPLLIDGDNNWYADYVRLRFVLLKSDISV